MTEEVAPDLIWVEKPLVLEILERYAPDLVDNGSRAPLWAIAAVECIACVTSLGVTDLTVEKMLRRVRGDQALQQAISGVYHTGGSALAILEVVESWRSDER